MRESSLHIKRTLSHVESEVDIDIDNPENNFEKLLSMQPEPPAKEYRTLIQSMCENFLFEKNVIRKTSNVQIPPEVRTEIQRKETFNNYNLVKDYAKFVKNRDHFNNRKFTSCKTEPKEVKPESNRYKIRDKIIPTPQSQNSKTKLKTTKISFETPARLTDLLENKKNKMLMDQSLLTVEENKVFGILNDPHLKQKIFQQALFIERLYDIELQKQRENGINQSSGKIPLKFKGVHPKHMRIGTQLCKTQQDFHRKKHVYKQRCLRLYNYAYRMQRSSLQTKKAQNSLVISTMLKFNDDICRMKTSEQQYEQMKSKKHRGSEQFMFDEIRRTSNGKQKPNIFSQDLQIKKLFLKYSNGQSSDPEQIYKHITEVKLKQFFKDFGLEGYLENNPEMQDYLEKKDYKITIDPEIDDAKTGTNIEKRYTMFDFLEILYIMAAKEQNNQGIHIDISQFLEEKIWSQQDKVTPEPWLRLEKIKRSHKYQKLFKISKLEERSKMIFQHRLKKQGTSKNGANQALLSFEQIIETGYKIKLFPLLISKKSLRFTYLYCRSQDEGVKASQFMDIWIICSLLQAPHKETEHKIKWIADHLKKYTFDN